MFETADRIEIPIELIIEAINEGDILCKQDLTKEQLNKIPKNVKDKLEDCEA